MSHSPVSTPATTVYSEHAPNGKSSEDGEGSKGSLGNDISYHARGLSSYIFDVGYMQQNWTDIQIVFFDQSLKLHRIVLSRSPFLARVMLNYVPGASIRLQFADENITPESVHIVLRHLYDPAQHLVNAHNARAVLAAAYLFEGMPELAHHAYTICRQSISPDSITDYVYWLNNAPSRNASGQAGTMFGSVAIHEGLATAPSSESSETWRDEERGRYGEWSARLKQDVFDYLIRGLPGSLESPLASNTTLLSVYSQLPFELFKVCVENPSLPITPTQNRFAFAKKAIAQRKKAASAAQMEESVVLAVGDEHGTVHVTHRPKRSRTALWKVEGSA